MKILIFGHSRSGSTLLMRILSKKNNLSNLEEGYRENPNIFTELKDKDNYIIKILADTLLIRDRHNIPLDVFDKVYITDRNDKTSAMASLYLSTLTDDWGQPNNQELNIPLSWFLHYSQIVENYYSFLTEIRVRHPSYVRLEYNDILDLAKEEGIYSASKMNYPVHCKNYADMSVKMRYLIDKLEQKFGKF